MRYREVVLNVEAGGSGAHGRPLQTGVHVLHELRVEFLLDNLARSTTGVSACCAAIGPQHGTNSYGMIHLHLRCLDDERKSGGTDDKMGGVTVRVSEMDKAEEIPTLC